MDQNRVFNVRLEEELDAALRAQAERFGVTRADVAKNLLRAALLPPAAGDFVYVRRGRKPAQREQVTA